MNLSSFSYLLSLNIEDLRTLTSLNGLLDIPTVRLTRCDGLRDLSGLGRNRYVEVTTCTGC